MKGFTLVEVLVSTLIMGILFVGIYIVLSTGDITYQVDSAFLDLQQQARQGMAWMVRELREAQNIQITVVDSDSDRISFNTFSGTGIMYYRDISQNRLIREYPAGTTTLIADNITRLKFSLSANILEIQLRAYKSAKQKPLTFSLTEKVRLRNG